MANDIAATGNSTERSLTRVEQPNPLNPFARPELQGEYWTTLDLNSLEGKFYVDAAFGDKVDDISKWINKTFVARDVLCHDANTTDEATGEVIPLTRCVLIGLKGEMVAWTGRGATRAMIRLAQTWGAPPWENGLPLKFAEISVGGNKRTHTIQIDQDAASKMQSATGGKRPARGQA